MSAPLLLVDLDGTLADTFPSLLRAALDALAAHDIATIRDANDPVVRSFTSRGARVMLECLSGEVPNDALLDTMLQLYEQDPITGTSLFAGTQSWFEAAELVIATNKPRRFAAPLISAICPETSLFCPEDAGASKPDPAMLHLAIETASNADRAVYVGDDPRDEEAAEAAGIPFIAATYGYGWMHFNRAAYQGLRIAHPSELPDLLRQL